MGRIIAIGGGEISKGETAVFDDLIVAMAKRERPNFLFVPTASRDAGGYINTMKREYKTKRGCAFSTLLFYLDNPTDETVRRKVEWADIIYVGGGNTAEMMEKWRERGLDALLKKAYADGKLLCGISAGSICWFRRGHSDSESFSGGAWEYISVNGLSLIDAAHCPHYNEAGRESFDKTLKDSGETGIALENGSALVIDGESLSIATSGGAAYLIRGGEKTALFAGVDYPLSLLNE